MSLAKDNTPFNIYHSGDVAEPAATFAGGKYTDPLTTSRTRTQGWLLSDTLGVLDDTLLVTAGARHQKVVIRGYNKITGAENAADSASTATTAGCQPTAWFTSRGKKWRCTRTIPKRCSLVKRPLKTPPTTAPSTGMAHSKQNEVGVKADFGRIGGSLGLFEIQKPSGLINSDNVYVMDGEQRHRGVEAERVW